MHHEYTSDWHHAIKGLIYLLDHCQLLAESGQSVGKQVAIDTYEFEDISKRNGHPRMNTEDERVKSKKYPHNLVAANHEELLSKKRIVIAIRTGTEVQHQSLLVIP